MIVISFFCRGIFYNVRMIFFINLRKNILVSCRSNDKNKCLKFIGSLYHFITLDYKCQMNLESLESWTCGFGRMLRQRFIPLTVIVRNNHFANSFIQESPQHHNSYLSDPFLRRNLKRILPDEVFQIVNEDLVRFGHRCSTDIWDLGKKLHWLISSILI